MIHRCVGRWSEVSIGGGLEEEFPEMSDRNPATSDTFYGSQYAHIYGQVASEIRREAFGEDLGQESWRSATEQAEIAELLRLSPKTRALDVAWSASCLLV
jgi:hypothetical protein